MLKLSTRGRYATRFMIELSYRYGAGFVLLKDIAKCQEISEGYLEQILPLLKVAGLIHSKRGARGGYTLAKPPSQISLRDIVMAVEGNLAFLDCIAMNTICPKVNSCESRDIWAKMSKKMNEMFEATNLADMITQKKKN